MFPVSLNILMFGQNKRTKFATKMKNLVKYLHYWPIWDHLYQQIVWGLRAALMSVYLFCNSCVDYKTNFFQSWLIGSISELKVYDADIGGICGWRRFPKASKRFPLPASRPAHRFPAPLSAHLVIANCTNTQHAHSTQTHRAHRVGMLCWLIAIFPAPPTSGRGRIGSTDCHRATPHMCSLSSSSLFLGSLRCQHFSKVHNFYGFKRP